MKYVPKSRNTEVTGGYFQNCKFDVTCIIIVSSSGAFSSYTSYMNSILLEFPYVSYLTESISLFE